MKQKLFAMGCISLATAVAAHAADSSAPICGEFRKLLHTQGGMSAYKIETPRDRDGNIRVPDIDVDGDGVADEVMWNCPGSASIVPPDPCVLSIRFASGKKLEFEEARFYGIKRASKLYLVAEDYGRVDQRRPRAADVRKKIFGVDGSGVHLICSDLSALGNETSQPVLTPLYWAQINGYEDLAKQLLARGAKE